MEIFVCCIKVENLYNMRLITVNGTCSWNRVHTHTKSKLFEKEREKKHAADFDSFRYFKLHMFINELACDVNMSNIWTDASPSLVIIYYIPCECVNEFTTTHCVVFAKRFHLQISAIHAPCEMWFNSPLFFMMWSSWFAICTNSPSFLALTVFIGFWCNNVRFDFIAKETDRED